MPTGDTETTKNGSTKGCQMKALSLEDSLSPKHHLRLRIQKIAFLQNGNVATVQK